MSRRGAVSRAFSRAVVHAEDFARCLDWGCGFDSDPDSDPDSDLNSARNFAHGLAGQLTIERDISRHGGSCYLTFSQVVALSQVSAAIFARVAASTAYSPDFLAAAKDKVEVLVAALDALASNMETERLGGAARVCRRLVAVAARALPSGQRARYTAEWLAELWEIGTQPRPRRHQLVHAMRLLAGCVRLRHSLTAPVPGAAGSGAGGGEG